MERPDNDTIKIWIEPKLREMLVIDVPTALIKLKILTLHLATKELIFHPMP